MSAEQDLADANVKISNLLTEVTRFRDAAMGLNNIYPTITEGRQTVGDGKYFSVPGGGAYMRLYRRQGTTAELIAEFADRSEINGILDQLGPLLGRGVVGGSGDLMARGAGNWMSGMGNSTQLPGGAAINDANQAPFYNHFYPITSSTENGPGFSGSVIRAQRGETSFSELAIALDAINKLSFRSQESNDWADAFTNENIIGLVSLIAGQRGGALFEEGSNDDGYYIRLAGNIQICWFHKSDGINQFTTSQGNLGASPNITMPNFPKPFLAGSSPCVSPIFRSSNATGTFGSIAGPETYLRAGDSYRYLKGDTSPATSASCQFSYVAVGRYR